MRIKTLINRLTDLESVLIPVVTQSKVFIMNGVDSNGVIVSTREIVINMTPTLPVKLGIRRRY